MKVMKYSFKNVYLQTCVYAHVSLCNRGAVCCHICHPRRPVMTSMLALVVRGVHRHVSTVTTHAHKRGGARCDSVVGVHLVQSIRNLYYMV